MLNQQTEDTSMFITKKFDMKKVQMAILIALGVAGLGFPLFKEFEIWNNGLVLIDVVDLLSYIPYAIWPVSMYAGMKDGFESKKALELNFVVVVLLIAYTILSILRRSYPQYIS